MRGKYWKSDSHTLELNERGRREPSSQGSAPTSSADRIQPAFVASSTSEEIITEPHNVDGIRKTLEIEVKNEAADNSNDGRKAYKEDWNSVRRTSPLDFPLINIFIAMSTDVLRRLNFLWLFSLWKGVWGNLAWVLVVVNLRM